MDVSAAATEVQRRARGWHARGCAGAMLLGKQSFVVDEANRAKLGAWVDQQVGSASNSKLEKNGGARKYRTTLEKKTAVKVADFQRTRAAKVKGSGAGIRKWLPPGVDVAFDGESGRRLVATRKYRPGDIVIVETVALMAASQGVFTDEWSPTQQEQLFLSHKSMRSVKQMN
jgi:hypothetical protein